MMDRVFTFCLHGSRHAKTCLWAYADSRDQDQGMYEGIFALDATHIIIGYYKLYIYRGKVIIKLCEQYNMDGCLRGAYHQLDFSFYFHNTSDSKR